MKNILRIIGFVALLYCVYEIICGVWDVISNTPDTMLSLRLIIGCFIFYVATEMSKKHPTSESK